MAWIEKYVTRTAPGGGSGAVGSPWTVDEAIAAALDASNPTRLNVLDDGTPYSITTTKTPTNSGTQTKPFMMQGYTSTPGDGGRPTFTLGANVDLFTINSISWWFLKDLILDGNSRSQKAIYQNGNGVLRTWNLKYQNFGGTVCDHWNNFSRHYYGEWTANAGRCIEDRAGLYGCLFHRNTAALTINLVSGNMVRCIVAKNTGATGGVSYSNADSFMGAITGNTFDANTGYGLRAIGSYPYEIANNLFTRNGTYGVTSDSNKIDAFLQNNGFYGNVLGETNNIDAIAKYGNVTLTGNPYLDADTAPTSWADAFRTKWALNAVAGAGAAARAAASISYFDMGASQHLDSGGGSIFVIED